MARIVSCKIEGLAGRRKPVSLDFDRQLNIVFGLNGSGKTSLLRILHAAMQDETSSLATVPFATAEVVVYSLDHATEFTYRLAKPDEISQEQLTLFGQEKRAWRDREVLRLRRRRWRWEVEPEMPSKVRRWRHEFLPTSRLLTTRHEVPGPEEDREQALSEDFANELERAWLDLFGRVQANVRRVQENGLLSIVGEFFRDKDTSDSTEHLDATTAYNRLDSFLTRQDLDWQMTDPQRFQQMYDQDSTIRQVVKHIDEVERAVEAALAPKSKLESLIARLFSGDKRIEFGPSSIKVELAENLEIPLASLSSGEKQVLLILLHTMRAEQSSIMIDEPEISLHIDWQNELIDAMREVNPDAQLILATHSPEILAKQPDRLIFALS